MDQEMDEYKTPTASRNNTQNMVIDVMSRNNTQQTDQNMIDDEYESLNESRNNTQQTNQELDENGEDNDESPPSTKKRKRTTKKKGETLEDNETSTSINNSNKRASATVRNKSNTIKSKKKAVPQTATSDIEETNDKSTISEKPAKTKKSVGRNPWTIEDDKRLVDAVLVNLQDVPWSKIARENFPNRDRSGCYSRWNVIKKRLYQDTHSGGSN
ncbi:4124_t:CDS:2 [Funneliformis geosporum]|uniref:5166_t:CDS:1 n=1 Tax=Funneliformis geosporum TaxID=1117311 RepID=A0A9W4WYJ8_9GLOM|nr:4124_t:CDS:2 [Funneliformis geosporum]CAI2188767.1 5166_t:CDS:2 [Funneliformis geosporum]